MVEVRDVGSAAPTLSASRSKATSTSKAAQVPSVVYRKDEPKEEPRAFVTRDASVLGLRESSLGLPVPRVTTVSRNEN